MDTDPLAVNFSATAIQDDGSCCYVSGCTDPYSINFDSTACHDNGSCVPAILDALINMLTIIIHCQHFRNNWR